MPPLDETARNRSVVCLAKQPRLRSSREQMASAEARLDEDAEVEEIIARAEHGELPPHEALRQRAALLTSSMRSKLSNSWVRLCNVFKSWDDSGDGMVTRQEFIRGLAVLGVAASPADVAELFTALVTVLLTGGSEGLGAIAGSAIFNTDDYKATIDAMRAELAKVEA